MNFDAANAPIASPDALPDIIEIPIPILEPDLDLDVPLAAETLEIDPESVVEEAELLLRVGAPHDFDVLVIGGGPGGLTAAKRAAQGGLQVALVAERIGGAYLHDGCIASKMLLEATKIKPDLGAIQGRKAELVARMEATIRAELEETGVEIIVGRARFVEAHSLEIESDGQMRRVTAIHIVIAAGSAAQKPGFDGAAIVTPDEILRQTGVPPRLIVVGAGTVGVEIAAIFAGLGTRVTLLEPSAAILPGFDDEISAELRLELERRGIAVETGIAVGKIEGDGVARLFFERDGVEISLEAEQILWATGRVAALENLGLENAEIEVSGGKIEVESDFQTSTSGVYAIGDCIRKQGWANQAVRDGHQVAGTILGLKDAQTSHFVPIGCTTSPEVASVGLTLAEALELGIAAKSCRARFGENVRSIIENAAKSEAEDGFVKLVFDGESGRIVGCQIIGADAMELINEAALSLRAEMTLRDLATVTHSHPSRGEVFADAAREGLSQSDFSGNLSSDNFAA